MRKFLIFFLMGMILLGGCAISAVPPAAPQQFNATAQVCVGEHEFVAQLQQLRPGTLAWTYTAPSEIAGLQLHLQGDSVTLRDGEITAEVPIESLPLSNKVVLLNGVLMRLAQGNVENFTLAGTVNGFDYTAELSPQGELIGLNIPALNMEVTLLHS
ncbi:MAG: hypothetical protein FWD06_01675 [Oscillospiraceae bacterium]|nr:hypothetical protein [Oscillospiraceae bacterium]